MTKTTDKDWSCPATCAAIGFVVGLVFIMLLRQFGMGVVGGWFLGIVIGVATGVILWKYRCADAQIGAAAAPETGIAQGTTGGNGVAVGGGAALAADAAVTKAPGGDAAPASEPKVASEPAPAPAPEAPSEPETVQEAVAEVITKEPAAVADEDFDKDGIVEGTGEGAKPATLDGPREGGADNLKEIKGVGPKMEAMLNGMGFYHFDQIAAWSPDEVAWVNANLEGFKGRVTRDDWVAQAKILASGGDTEFSKRVEDGGVY
ncbi:hypothetical protein [Algicella marina]|uniref:hypothetical protein n=1 Tax=Algicella marina TaxID=2683284 RepID=UPI0024E00BC8|nr:hypothetical protein [Algicella marina]